MDGDDRFAQPGPLGHPGQTLTPAELSAQWAELDAWVARLHAAFEDFWPPARRMDHGGVRDLPWPPCWRKHPGLVEDLVALRAWHEQLLLAAGNESAARSWMEWTSTVQHLLVPRVQRLARYCQHGHRDPAIGGDSRVHGLMGKYLPSVAEAASSPASAAASPRRVHPKRRAPDDPSEPAGASNSRLEDLVGMHLPGVRPPAPPSPSPPAPAPHSPSHAHQKTTRRHHHDGLA